MSSVNRRRRPNRKLARWGRGRAPFAFRLRAVKLYLEEGLPSRLICRELGVHKTTLHAWIRKYRECGEEGLKSPRAGGASARKDGPLHQKIAEVKRQQPAFGVKRISQWLRPRVITVPPYSRLPRAASLI